MSALCLGGCGATVGDGQKCVACATAAVYSPTAIAARDHAHAKARTEAETGKVKRTTKKGKRRA